MSKWWIYDKIIGRMFVHEEEFMENEAVSKNFIEQEIDKDLAEGVLRSCVHPFPAGAERISAHRTCQVHSFELRTGKKYNGTFHMRFDDTNPTKEKVEFVDSIKEDIQWLGADWEDHLYFASDYFEQMYECAVKLIKKERHMCVT